MKPADYDTCFDLVSNEHRRRIIRRVREDPADETAVEDLVEHLHDGESTLPTDEGPNRTHLSIQLVHNHLPRLADHGVIHYDRESETVQYRPDERIESVLEFIPAEPAQASPDP